MRRFAPELLAIGALVLAALGGVLIWQSLMGNPGGHTWTAAFTDARGLLPGNDVLDDGAIVGRVSSISLSRQGTALVRFRLFDRAAAPRADAVAAIEPEDLLGDTYMSLSPGTASEPLRGSIEPDNTVNAPHLDQVLDAFQPNVRDGLQTLLLDGGIALDQRGAALARATVAVRPALAAAQGVLDELDAQNGSLAALIPTAERVAEQIDSRRAAIGPLLDGLARTLAQTAGDGTALAQGISGLPATLGRVRSTTGELASAAGAATPLVARLERMTGQLTAVVRGLPALTDRVRGAAPALDGALGAARSALVAGAPGLSRLAASLPTVRSQAPRIATLLSELDQAAPGIAQGFFVDFPDQADESGRQPLDPFADPRRAYWRGAAVFSCEAFGVPVAPGCLTKALENLVHQPPPSSIARQPAVSRLLDFLLRP